VAKPNFYLLNKKINHEKYENTALAKKVKNL